MEEEKVEEEEEGGEEEAVGRRERRGRRRGPLGRRQPFQIPTLLQSLPAEGPQALPSCSGHQGSHRTNC